MTATGAAESYLIDVFDSAAQQRSLQLSFVKQAANTWSLVASGGPGDTVTVSPAPVLAFDAMGQLTGPRNYSVNATFADDPTDPTTAAFTLDVGGFTQFAGSFLAYDYARDGYAPAALSGIDVQRSRRGDRPASTTAAPGRCTGSRSPTSPIPTASASSPATSTPNPRLPDRRWSPAPARAGWAKSTPARWRSRTSIWPRNSAG